MVNLKFEEKTYEVEYKNKFYKVIQVADWERGEFETVVQTYDEKEISPKEQKNVLLYFENNYYKD